MTVLDSKVEAALRRGLDANGNIIVVTGAGVSAESGIRTYRGEGGVWSDEGSSAMAKATGAYFLETPRKSWAWHLARRSEVLPTRPNPAHQAIARFEALAGDRFTLVTQNIDRLHLAAGNTVERTIELHGYIHGMRCTLGCRGVIPIPGMFNDWSDDGTITDEHLDSLTCSSCGMAARPHVLWFDEFYDDTHYSIGRAQRAAATASLCITVGTSGGVPIAARLAGIAARSGAVLIDVNPNDNELRQLARTSGGAVIRGSASTAMPQIAEFVRNAGQQPESQSVT
jgi:NAD-dependent deacetylase